MRIYDFKYYCLIAVAFVSLTVQASGQSLDMTGFVPTTTDFRQPAVNADVGMIGKEKGILVCPTDNNCRVMGMPLLWQSDPRVDAGYEPEKGVGCYDTSIVSVIIAAMYNRHPSIPKVPVGWRVRKFMDIQPGIGGNGEKAPKEIKQLSYEYSVVHARAAAVAAAAAKNQAPVFKVPDEQPIYFHEVLWALNGGKVNENCKPEVYTNCTEVSNKWGHSFYKWLVPSDNNVVTDQYVIDKMKAGYVMMIAYSRYIPLVGLDKNGKKTVDYAYANVTIENVPILSGPGGIKVGMAPRPKYSPSLHKVVFIGFNEGKKYPLLIQDVGDGMQYWARLSTDLWQRNFALRGGGPPGTPATPSLINYPRDVKVFLEYEGQEKTPNSMAYFVQHVDGLRILNSNEKVPKIPDIH